MGRLHDLSEFKASRGNHARRAGVKFSIAERLAGSSQLRFRQFQRALCGSQLLLRVVVGDAGGETARQQRALPVKGRLRHAQLSLRCGYPCGRGVKISLLLGRIEPGQEVAGIDVGPDIHQAREDAPAHTKGKVGAEAGLDLAGQCHGRLSLARLHELGAHQRGALDRSGGALIAGTQWRSQKRQRDCGTHGPRNGHRRRMENEMVHDEGPLIKLYRIVSFTCALIENMSSRNYQRAWVLAAS